jgi:hypothetical protein
MDPSLRILLANCAEAGEQVEFYAVDDACPVCRALAGQLFDPKDALDVPVPGCQNETCRCDYLPVF